MKELIKKQDEDIRIKANSFSSLGGFDLSIYDDVAFKNLKDFISKVRKETAEMVCDEMIKGKVKNFKPADLMTISAEHEKRVGTENCIGYYSRIGEEREIKKDILNQL